MQGRGLRRPETPPRAGVERTLNARLGVYRLFSGFWRRGIGFSPCGVTGIARINGS